MLIKRINDFKKYPSGQSPLKAETNKEGETMEESSRTLENVLGNLLLILYLILTGTLIYADYYMNRQITPQDFRSLENEDLEDTWGYELKYPCHGRPFYLEQRADVFRVRGQWVARGVVKNISIRTQENKSISAAVMPMELHLGEAWSLPTEFHIRSSDFKNICLPEDIESAKGNIYKFVFIEENGRYFLKEAKREHTEIECFNLSTL